MKKAAFKHIVKTKVNKAALDHLNLEKVKHTKVANIKHTQIQIREYLNSVEVSIHEAKFVFALRSRMLDLKVNFRGKYNDIVCPCCNLEEDSQQHLLTCTKLSTDGLIVSSLPNYEQLFSEDVAQQVAITRIIKQNDNMRTNEILADLTTQKYYCGLQYL